jgi:thiamine-phosphate pyrophosphorylase
VDAKLLAWGRAAASRACSVQGASCPPVIAREAKHSPSGGTGGLLRFARNDGGMRCIPTLWLFTDSKRLPDPRPSVARLPRGHAGVVFRHDDHPDRAALGRAIARICRARGLLLVVAGDVRLAVSLRAGVHLRGGRWPGMIRTKAFVTSSAHNARDLHRAARAGASLAFLSPVFATPSHPGAPSLGPVRWSAFARRSTIAIAALGGIDGTSVRRLPFGLCHGVGAIGALA